MKTLQELANKNIDLWVAAVSNVCADPVLFKAVMNDATNDEIRNWLDMDRCPGELERAIAAVCEKWCVSFNENGTVACRAV